MVKKRASKYVTIQPPPVLFWAKSVGDLVVEMEILYGNWAVGLELRDQDWDDWDEWNWD